MSNCLSLFVSRTFGPRFVSANWHYPLSMPPRRTSRYATVIASNPMGGDDKRARAHPDAFTNRCTQYALPSLCSMERRARIRQAMMRIRAG